MSFYSWCGLLRPLRFRHRAVLPFYTRFRTRLHSVAAVFGRPYRVGFGPDPDGIVGPYRIVLARGNGILVISHRSVHSCWGTAFRAQFRVSGPIVPDRIVSFCIAVADGTRVVRRIVVAGQSPAIRRSRVFASYRTGFTGAAAPDDFQVMAVHYIVVPLLERAVRVLSFISVGTDA